MRCDFEREEALETSFVGALLAAPSGSLRLYPEV